MNRLALLAALTLTGCGFLFEDPSGAPPSCVSACGARLYGSTDCAGFQDAERRALENLHHVFGPEMCDALEGWRVSVSELADGGFDDPWKGHTGGRSGCDQVFDQNGWAIVLGDWHELSYFHEVAHHMECPEESEAHVGWEEDGVYDLVWKAARAGVTTAQAPHPRARWPPTGMPAIVVRPPPTELVPPW